jgi:hypothetical protein
MNAVRPFSSASATALNLGRAQLGVVIVNYRGVGDTIECLESLLRCRLPMKIVVVDNCSADGSVEQLRDWAAGHVPPAAQSPEMESFSKPPLRKPLDMAAITETGVGIGPVEPLSVVSACTNRGFAGGNNLGLRHLMADPELNNFWLLNNDTVVTQDAPLALLTRMAAGHRIGMCGTIVRHYWAPGRIQALNGSSFNVWTGLGRALGGEQAATAGFNAQEIADATEFVLGASLAVSREFLTKVGPMSEDYFLYFEEIDWAVRNKALGNNAFEIAFAQGATVFHKAGRSIGSPSAKSARSAFSDYWMTRSRLKFVGRHFPWLWPWHWLLSWIFVVRRLWRRQFTNAGAIARAAMGRKAG